MYKIKSIDKARELYNAVLSKDLTDYKELLPYAIPLDKIFREASLFRQMSDQASIGFMEKVIDLLESVPVDSLTLIPMDYYLYPNEGPAKFPSEYLNYLCTIFYPKETENVDLLGYLKSFERLYNHGAYDSARDSKDVMHLNNFDAIIDCYNKPRYTFVIMIQDGKWNISKITKACYYAHQDEFDLGTLESFLEDKERHLMHVIDDINGDILDKNKEVLEQVYMYILNRLRIIKTSKIAIK